MDHKKTRRSSWWFTAPLATLASVYFAFIWIPGRLAIERAKDRLECDRHAVAQSAHLSKTLAGAERDLARVQSAVAQWENDSPRPHGVLHVLEKINSLARDAGLTVDRFDPRTTVVHEKIQETPLVVECSGEYAQVHEFLRDVERLSAAIWIDSVRLEQATSGTGRLRCEANLTIFCQNPANIQGVTTSASKEDRPSWQDLVSWRQDDPRTRAAGPLGKKRDPFRPGVSENAR